MERRRTSTAPVVALTALLTLATAWPAAAQTPLPATDLGGCPGYAHSGAAGINASGQIVGFCYDGTMLEPSASQIFVMKDGVKVLLPNLDTDTYKYSVPSAINDNGEVIGTCTNNPSASGWGSYSSQACYWSYSDTDGQWHVTGLGFLTGDTFSKAVAINSSGYVLAASWTYYPFKGFIWHQGSTPLVVPLTVDNSVDGSPVDPKGINNSNVVIGKAYFAQDSLVCPYGGCIPAVVWTPNADIATGGSAIPITATEAEASAINNNGEVVGSIGWVKGFYYLPADRLGSTAGLHVMEPPQGWDGIETYAISDSGFFVFANYRYGTEPGSTRTHDLYLTRLDKVDTPAFIGEFNQDVSTVALNEQGQIAGALVVPLYDSGGTFIGVIMNGFSGSADYSQTPVVTTFTPLGSLGGTNMTGAADINEDGVIVGVSLLVDGTTLRAAEWNGAPPAFGINNIPANAAYGGQFTPTFDYSGDGKTSATTSTPDVCALGRGGVVKFVGVGTCTLTAHAAAGATSPAMDGAPQSFSVGKGAAAITIKNLPKNAVYGDKFNPTYAFTGDGVKSVTSNTPDVCEPAKGGVKFVGVGACELVAHITEGVHYLAGDGTPQSFAVGKAPTTISINNIPKDAKTGGSFVPTFKYSGDGATSVTSGTLNVCTVSGGTVNFIAGGPCKLTAHAAEGTLYVATDGKGQSFPVAK